MPFIIKNIEDNYDAVVYNGALKKNIYVMILDSLYHNELIRMDYHVTVTYSETHDHQDSGHFHYIP